MIAAPIHLAGERLMLDPGGYVVWPAERLLAVADLHLEKGSAFAARGRGLLPPYDTRETLERLALALRRWKPARLVLLGDSFHDPAGSVRLPQGDAAMLARLLAGMEVVWVLGNHDPVAPAGLPGVAVEEWRLGPLGFRHVARPGAAGELSGHFHPKATMQTRAGRVTRPCFLADAKRLLLPAFGAYTGGLDIRDPAIAALFPRGGRAFLRGGERLFSFPTGPLRASVLRREVATGTAPG
ncbi:MAG TPA: ligase-associated DNA damage response endonuclease PdeM [Falsiroseomonas sp.]|jgi:hypothetical protein|nr:ligase-associated DNA damage response endonuclease PdeM [Falsiroseomonas sp.]